MSPASSTLNDDLATIRQWSLNRSSATLAEIDTINIPIGSGAAVIAPGVVGALRADFNALITGAYLHEFLGTSGSIQVLIEKAHYVIGTPPAFTSIVASAPPTITSGRYSEDIALVGWTPNIDRGDVLRFTVNSASTFTAVLFSLRIRRLEP